MNFGGNPLTKLQKNQNQDQKDTFTTVNPFTARACTNFRAERCMDAPTNSVFSSPITHLLSVLCVVMPVRKIRQKGLRVSDFALSLVVFKRHYGSEEVNLKDEK